MSLGLLLAFGTSVSWAFGNAFIQRSGRVLGGPRAMLWALVVGAFFCTAVSLAMDERSAPVTGAVLAWTAVGGVSGLCAYGALFYAFTRAPLSLAVPLVSGWSLVSAALSFLAFGERVSGGQLGGAALVLTGVLCVSAAAARGSGDQAGEGASPSPAAPSPAGRRALWAALLSGLGFGVMIPSVAHTAPALGAFGSTAAVYALCIVLALPLGRALGVDLRPPPRGAVGLVLGTGVTETLGFVLIALARRLAPMALVAPTASLASGLTILYAWLVLRERPHPVAGLGALFASAGLVVMSL